MITLVDERAGPAIRGRSHILVVARTVTVTDARHRS
jgi:hypothetical protein